MTDFYERYLASATDRWAIELLIQILLIPDLLIAFHNILGLCESGVEVVLFSTNTHRTYKRELFNNIHQQKYLL
jgi:hypothetical protein